MYCNNCGARVSDGIRHCPNCGAVIRSSQPLSAGNREAEAPLADPASVLLWGILALVFSLTICFLGIIFGCIGLVKANQYFSIPADQYNKKVSLGRSLSIAGIIIGVCMTIMTAVGIYLLIRFLNPQPHFI